jgi:hypothetical protein
LHVGVGRERTYPRRRTGKASLALVVNADPNTEITDDGVEIPDPRGDGHHHARGEILGKARRSAREVGRGIDIEAQADIARTQLCRDIFRGDLPNIRLPASELGPSEFYLPREHCKRPVQCGSEPYRQIEPVEGSNRPAPHHVPALGPSIAITEGLNIRARRNHCHRKLALTAPNSYLRHRRARQRHDCIRLLEAPQLAALGQTMQ